MLEVRFGYYPYENPRGIRSERRRGDVIPKTTDDISVPF